MISSAMKAVSSKNPGRVAYINARLLDPASGLDEVGGLFTDGTKIADLGPRLFNDGLPEDSQIIDCAGLCLSPGLIDMRVQLREPGAEHKETIESASRAAAYGGITSMVALPNTEPVIDDVAVLEFLARRARETKLVKVYAYGTVTRGLKGRELTEFGLLTEFGAVGFTDGLTAISDSQVMRRALSYSRTFGQVIVQHPEDPALASGAMNEGEVATRLGLAGIPTAAEVIMVERDLRLLELTGGRYHVANVTTAAAIEAIQKAKRQGLSVTCDTAPHYFTLNENAVGDYRSFAKVSPPLRGEADRQAVENALSDGTIDAIASDHSPHDQDSKRLPFAIAEPGIVGLESLLPLSLQLYHNGRASLLDVLAKLTTGPAEILGLSGGSLTVGAAADLTLFDLDKPWQINPDAFQSKSKNSPFTDHPVQGLVRRCIVDGRCVYDPDDKKES
ncbi:dihydroorotase [Pelagibius sp. Alg239-R121]|uniref:dihydroorotase n=1 Tax=Pelagibius sp. Alg239-R121 TaxID=2993448 RepID=UPI0024A76CBA|nr:dihydroorotase [Pelagibius sp. Alg239-R121]